MKKEEISLINRIAHQRNAITREANRNGKHSLNLQYNTAFSP